MKPIMILKKVSDIRNAYGYDFVAILQFNYDGNGNAIVQFYNKGDIQKDLKFCLRKDLNNILFGNPTNGEKWYRHVINHRKITIKEILK
jgi:hypothetical protein